MMTQRMRLAASILLLAGTLSAVGGPAEAQSWTPGGAMPGQWMFGARIGPSGLTQSLGSNIDTATGPALNFQGMYAINNWMMLGLMLEWERRGVDRERPYLDMGSLDTVSLLPTVEFRPGHIGPFFPYGSVSVGVNFNSFSEDDGIGSTRISPSNNFAFRLAAGGDYFITKTLAVNAELAWKRNDGHADINPAIAGINPNEWNASSLNFLIGIRWFY